MLRENSLVVDITTSLRLRFRGTQEKFLRNQTKPKSVGVFKLNDLEDHTTASSVFQPSKQTPTRTVLSDWVTRVLQTTGTVYVPCERVLSRLHSYNDGHFAAPQCLVFLTLAMACRKRSQKNNNE